MGVTEKIMEALRAGILLNEKVTTLVTKVDRMDVDMRDINNRLIRLETMVEVTQSGPKNPKPFKLPEK